MKKGEIFLLRGFLNCHDSETKLCWSIKVKGFPSKVDAISHVPGLVSLRNVGVMTS